MKILAVCNLYPPYVVGGNEVRLDEILRELAQRHEVFVLSSRYADAPDDPRIERSLKQVVPYPRPIGNPRLFLFKEWRIARQNYACMQAALRRVQPDVVYMSDTKRVFLGAPFAAADADYPMVWDITDLSLQHYQEKAALRRWMSCMDIRRLPFRYSIAISDFIRDRHRKAGVLPENSVAIRQGVHLQNFTRRSPLPPDAPPRKLLFVGGLIPDKGLHIVLAGLKLLVDEAPDYRLTVCGDSLEEEYKAQLKAYVASQGLEGNVDFRGRVSSQEMPEVYRQHDIFVFSSIWDEPFASTPLEAMASGVPVVGTLVGGQQGFFINRHNAMTYGSEDPAELCSRVRELDDRSLYDGIAQRGFEQVHTDHDFGDYVRKIEAVLQEAAQTKA